MSKVFQLILVMLLIFAGSIFLTPFLHSILPMFKFEQIFNRLIMVFTIAAAIFVIRGQRRGNNVPIGRGFWRENGFDFSAPWKKLLLYGFLCGCLSVAFIIGWEVAFGPRYLRHPLLLQDIVERFFKGMLSGGVVGIVEEFFFRGFIFNYLQKRMPAILAVLLASAFYSLTHFLNNGQVFIPQNASIGDAFRLVFGYLEPFQNRWAEIFPQFFGLFVFGIVLCISFMRTKSLFLSIGIHAGAVFAIKFQHSFVRQPLGNLNYPFFGKSLDYDGSFEWMVLALLGFVLWFIILPRLSKNPLR